MDRSIRYSVNPDSPIAVYQQIENQIQFAIAAGKLEPHDALPSVNEMSVRLDVNPNTVTKAYRDLEIMGLVRARRGMGVSVTEQAPQLCAERILQPVREHLEEAVSECIACGIPPFEVREIVSRTIDVGSPPYMKKPQEASETSTEDHDATPAQQESVQEPGVSHDRSPTDDDPMDMGFIGDGV